MLNKSRVTKSSKRPRQFVANDSSGPSRNEGNVGRLQEAFPLRCGRALRVRKRARPLALLRTTRQGVAMQPGMLFEKRFYSSDCAIEHCEGKKFLYAHFIKRSRIIFAREVSAS
jgi:hypothetical protein